MESDDRFPVPLADARGAQPGGGTLQWLLLAATAVVTATAVAGLAYNIGRVLTETGADRLGASILTVASLAFIGVPAAFMWSYTVRFLRGQRSAAWRLLKPMAVVASAVVVVGAEALVVTGQLAAFAFMVGAFVAVVVCGGVLKRVLVRDRVEPPPPNWRERQDARVDAWLRDL